MTAHRPFPRRVEPLSAADDIPFDLPDAPGHSGAGASPPSPAALGSRSPSATGLDRTVQPPAAPPYRARGGSISARALDRPAEPPYIGGLNPEQRAAVEHLDGAVLVLAGAGTGKTRVLTTRIAHILATGRAWPSQVLAVTFTNKAAREMKARIGHLVGGAVEGMPWLGTFHSIGVRMLRKHHELVGLKSGFTILDTDDQLRLLKQVLELAGIDKERWPARQLAGLIDAWKNKGLTPDRVPNSDAGQFAQGRGVQLYASYQARLKELNACDFGDLLLECIRLFREHPDVLAEYHGKFRYILVDEYQDTNVAQYLWLRLLAQGSPNVCCVGDEDQSIYGWRGAEVDNILRFETDFPGATVIRLERNYRSTGHILAAASHLIAENTSRLGKTLFTDGDVGEKVTVTGVWDDEEEARVVGDDIEGSRKHGQALDDMAILVRASFQMRAFEDRFVTLGLPYRVIGGPRFYERQEIRDAIAYLEIVLNSTNDLKFERIVNVPKRGLGDTSVRRIAELARASGVSMYQAARHIVETDEIKGKARAALRQLLGQFEHWRRLADEMRHTELTERILDESGYTAMWQAEKTPQAHSRLENLKELVRYMGEYDTLEGFLEHVTLVMDVDNGNDGDRVSIMTLHAAKGLEFDTVYLPGWEEGLFPHQRSLDESGLAGLEEERRLAYVGLTRARKRARVSFAQNRRTRGLYQAATPSRFIDELPEANVDVVAVKSPFGGAYGGVYGAMASGGGRHNPFGASRFDTRKAESGAREGGRGLGERSAPRWSENNGSGDERSRADTVTGTVDGYATPGWQRAQRQWSRDDTRRTARTRRGGPLEIEGQLVAASSGVARHAVGDRVFHEKFGYGRVLSVDGNKLSVDFETSGPKHVVDSFLRST